MNFGEFLGLLLILAIILVFGGALLCLLTGQFLAAITLAIIFIGLIKIIF